MIANHDRPVKPEASLLGVDAPERPLKASPPGLLVSAALDEFIYIYIYILIYSTEIIVAVEAAKQGVTMGKIRCRG